jgi:hypothetical protein
MLNGTYTKKKNGKGQDRKKIIDVTLHSIQYIFLYSKNVVIWDAIGESVYFIC